MVRRDQCGGTCETVGGPPVCRLPVVLGELVIGNIPVIKNCACRQSFLLAVHEVSTIFLNVPAQNVDDVGRRGFDTRDHSHVPLQNVFRDVFCSFCKECLPQEFFFPLAAYSRDIGLAIIKWNLLAQGRCVIERKDFTFEFGFQGRLTTPLCSQGGEELRRRLRGLGVGVRMGGTGSFPTAVLGPPGGLPRRLTNRLKASKET